MCRLKVLLVGGYLTGWYVFCKLWRYPGGPVARVLRVNVTILKFIWCLLGSQCRLKQCQLGTFRLVVCSNKVNKQWRAMSIHLVMLLYCFHLWTPLVINHITITWMYPSFHSHNQLIAVMTLMGKGANILRWLLSLLGWRSIHLANSDAAASIAARQVIWILFNIPTEILLNSYM